MSETDILERLRAMAADKRKDHWGLYAASVAEVEQLRNTLTRAAEQFDLYAVEHRQKAANARFNEIEASAAMADAKAETNEWFAAMCRSNAPPPVAEIERLREVVRRALALKGGWREAIVELEDHCSEPVRLKSMLAAADQLDEWATNARAALEPK